MNNRHISILRRAGALAAVLTVLAGCGHNSGQPSAVSSQVAPGIRWNSEQPPELPALVATQTGSLAFRIDTGERNAEVRTQNDEQSPRSAFIVHRSSFQTLALPANTAKVVLQLSSDVLNPPLSIDITPDQFANGAVLFTVHSLPVGQYTVSAAVKDASNANLAAGSTTATVVAGTTTPVTLLLSTDPNSTTGALQISIDTTSTAAATAALTLPTSGQALQTVTLPTGSQPAGIAVDSSGKLWVADNGNSKVTKVDLSTTPATLTHYTVGTSPVGVAIDSSGNAWVTNNGSASVQKILTDGTVSGPYSVNSGAAGIAIDGSGNVWVANNGTFTSGTGGNGTTVQKLNGSGSVLATYTVPAGPWGIAIDSSGNAWVGTAGGVSKIATDGTVTSYSIDTNTAKHLQSGITVSPDGSIWTANDATNNATKLTSTGTVSGHFALGASPWGIVVDSYKAVWVTNAGGNTVTKLDSQGTVLGTFSLPSGSTPWGIALDGKGNPWVAGKGNDTLMKLGR